MRGVNRQKPPARPGGADSRAKSRADSRETSWADAPARGKTLQGAAARHPADGPRKLHPRGQPLTPAQAAAATALSGYRQSAWRAARLAEELETMRSLGQRITPLLSETHAAGPDRDQLARTVERMDLCSRRLQQQTRNCLDEQQALAGMLEGLADERLRLLLWLRYVRGLGWEPISERLEISERWARKLHLRALDELAAQQSAVNTGKPKEEAE